VAVPGLDREDFLVSNAARQELHALVDALPASEEQAARRYLKHLRDASDPYASLDKVEPLLDLATQGHALRPLLPGR
jgi:hypothetical protein